jgi:uncharacterized protein
MSKTVGDSAPFGANSPFFRIIKEGLEGLVDGEDYFDLLAEDVVFEYVISVPGYPRRIEGRQNIADLYSGYGDYMALSSADHLRVHRDPENWPPLRQPLRLDRHHQGPEGDPLA